METNSLTELKSLAQTLFERFFEDWRHLSDEHFLDYLKPKLDQVITMEELTKKIASDKKLKIKFGIDPTGPDVHLGHLLPIMVLRQFQKAGHEINLIIGDFTATIGDPTGRTSERPALTEKDIKQNMKTYLSQIGKYLNVKKTKNHRNSDWLSKRGLKNIIADLRNINLSEVLQREDFRKRLDKGHGLSVAEILYSYAQAIDSVELEPDIELGGRDQLLNFAHARKVMQVHGQEPEVAVTTPVLEGITGDGRKMSKSFGNYIAVNASLEDKFGKIMSIPDNLLESYYRAFSDIRESELNDLRSFIQSDPMEAKKQLAQFLVAIETQKLEEGIHEREKFEKRFTRKEYDADIPKIKAQPGWTYFDLLNESGLFESKSEIRRLFEQNGVHLVEPEEKEVSADQKVEEGTLKAGKRKFLRIVIK